MEKQKLNEAIHKAVFGKNIKNIREIGDFYKDINLKDISNLNHNVVNEQKEVFEWIFENPNYDFNGLFDNHYLERYGFTNEEFLRYFKVYYDDLLFIIDKYNKKEFLIKSEDFK